MQIEAYLGWADRHSMVGFGAREVAVHLGAYACPDKVILAIASSLRR